MRVCRMEPTEYGVAECYKLRVGFLTSEEEGRWVLTKTIQKFLPFLKSLPAGNMLDVPAYPLHLVLSEKKFMHQEVFPFWRLPVIEKNEQFFPEQMYLQFRSRLLEVYASHTLRDFEKELLKGYSGGVMDTPPAKYLLDFLSQKSGREKKWLYQHLGWNDHMSAYTQLRRFSLRGNYLAAQLFIAKIGLSSSFAKAFLPKWKKWILGNCVISRECSEITIKL